MRLVEANVATSTAIIVHPSDMYLVLVGRGGKHPNPVLPGGKIDEADGRAIGPRSARACIVREVQEELGTIFRNPRMIGQANDPLRDIRMVPASKLANSLTDPPLKELIQVEGRSTQSIRAHYGVPDFIFVGTIDSDLVRPTSELFSFSWIDLRELRIGSLSAGHDVILLTFREMIDNGHSQLVPGSLADFRVEEIHLFERYFAPK